MDSGFQVLDSRFFVSETWIPDSNCYWDFGILEPFSGFQSPEFRIAQAKLSWIQDSRGKNFLDSGFHKYKFPGFRILEVKISRIPLYIYIYIF